MNSFIHHQIMDEFDPFHIFNCASDHNGYECPKRTICSSNRWFKVNLNHNSSRIKLINLYHKYEQLQQLYHSMYTDSFSDPSVKVENHQICTLFKLYKNFQKVCLFLNKIKNNQSLTRDEIKVLFKFKDVKKFLISLN